MAADYSDPAIQQALNEIKNISDKTNWICLGYAPKNDTKLQLIDKGSGGLKAFVDQLSDGKIFYGLIAFEINKTKKFAYIAWCGEGVTGMKKGLFNNHANDVAKLFKGFHVQVNARNENDVNEKNIVSKLTKATGASYDSGAKIQGESQNVPSNVREGQKLATVSNATQKQADKSDYNKKNESAQFWNQNNQAATEAPKPAVKTDYNKKAESDAFWKKQKEEQEQAQREAAEQKSQARPTASSVRSQFENKTTTTTTAPSQPAVPRTAPPPKRPATPPPVVPEPEPEPQQTYEEPQQEEPQQNYEEPQQTYEEPQQTYEEPQQTYEEPQQNYEEPQQDTYQEEPQQQYGIGQCRALYEFVAENDSDLGFAEGEIITLLDKSDPSGWWQGDLNGKIGFFPSNFVEEI